MDNLNFKAFPKQIVLLKVTIILSSQAKPAYLLGVSRSCFNYWINKDMSIAFGFIEVIETRVERRVTNEELGSYIDGHKQPSSQHQGQAKVDNDSPFQGKKSREVAAMLMSYGSWRIPEQLEKVLIWGAPELLDAIAVKQIAPANAVLLLPLSTRWQQLILIWSKVTIIRFCKRLRRKKQTTMVYPQLE